MNVQSLFGWWGALPPWGRPLLLSFVVGAAGLAWLGARYQASRYEHGQPLRPPRQVQLWHVALALALLFFLKENNATAAAVLTWPNGFAYYEAHGGALWLGFLSGAYLGGLLGKKLAPVLLRRRAARAARLYGGNSGQRAPEGWMYGAPEGGHYEEQ